MPPIVAAFRLDVSFVAALLIALMAGCSSGESPSPSPGPDTGEAAGLIDGLATFYGAQPGDAASAIIAGDFNADGVQDIVFGASLADGVDDARPDAGEVHFFTGPFRSGDVRDAGKDEQGLTIYGANAGDQLGRAMAAGDVNGDRIDDIVVGAPAGDGQADDIEDAGEVHVIFGSEALGADVHELDLAEEGSNATIYGADRQDLVGYSVLAADISGDGTDDMIIGALYADGPAEARPESGEVYVLFGSPDLARVRDLRSQTADINVYAGAGDRLGEEVGADDINGDGVHDLVLPATFASGLMDGTDSAGQTHVIPAPLPHQIDTTQGQEALTVYGVDSGDQFGHSLGSGDVNGDGFADIFVAAVSSNGSGNQARLAGEAALVLGRELSVDNEPLTVDIAAGGAATMIYGASSNDRLGRSAAVGDVNGDGLADLLVAAPGGDGANGERSNAGEIYIILGASSLPGVIELNRGGADAIIEGLDPDDTLGSEVSGRPSLLVADLNDDRLGDVLAGSPRADGPDGTRTDAGEAYIFFATREP